MAQVIKNSDETAGAKAAVLKLADFAAEARNLMLEARKQAARIVADARAHVEEIRRQASETGCAEGYDRGLREGLAQGQAQARAEARRAVRSELAECDALALRIAQELAQARQQVLQEAHRGLLRLAVDMAEKIVGCVAAAGPAAAEHNLAKALELARCASELTVLVNPDQLGRLNEYKKTLVEGLGLRGQVRLVGDGRIQPGGVKVISRWGEIDATIRTQLTNVVEAMLGCSQAAPATRGGTSTAANDAAVLPDAGAMLPRPGPQGREVGEACSSGVDEACSSGVDEACSSGVDEACSPGVDKTCFSALVPRDQDVEAWHPATAAHYAAVPPAEAGPSGDPAGQADLVKLLALAEARAVGGLFGPANPVQVTGVTGQYISSTEAAATFVGQVAEVEPPFVVEPPLVVEPPFVVEPPDANELAPGWDVEAKP